MKKIVVYDAYGNHREVGLVERLLRWAWMKVKGK